MLESVRAEDSLVHLLILSCPVLTRYLPRPKIRKERNLLQDKNVMAEGEDETEVRSGALIIGSPLPDKQVADTIVSYWHQVCSSIIPRPTLQLLIRCPQNLTLALVSDAAVLQYPQLPPPIAERTSTNISLVLAELTVKTDVVLIPGKRDETGTKGYYNPIVFPNEFWHLRSQYIEINATTPTVPLQIVFQPMSYFKFQVFASMTSGFQEAIKQQGGGSAAEFDEVKRMLVETNPWFLGLTGVVSVLHVVSASQVFVRHYLTQL
jgi:cleft lip and palate transmembrane protein 1 (CLPTM1)